jgi:hypothetical protein
MSTTRIDPEYGLPVPMRGVEIDLGPQPEHIPPDAFADPHRHGMRAGDRREIVPEIAIDGVLEVTLLEHVGLHVLEIDPRGDDMVLEVPARVLIVDHEHGDELAIHVLRRRVGVPSPATGDDHRSDETGVHVPGLVQVRVVHPEHAAPVVRSWTGACRHWPDVRMRPARRHGITDRDPVVIVVRRAL